MVSSHPRKTKLLPNNKRAFFSFWSFAQLLSLCETQHIQFGLPVCSVLVRVGGSYCDWCSSKHFSSSDSGFLASTTSQTSSPSPSPSLREQRSAPLHDAPRARTRFHGVQIGGWRPECSGSGSSS